MATNLTTKQTIKVKVNQDNGSLVPQSKQPVVLKNTVQQAVGVGGLGNVNEGTPTNGDTLIYNSNTSLYDVRPLNVRDLSDITGTPANGDIIVYSASTNTFYYGTAPQSVTDLVDVDSSPRANGSVLTYNTATNTYVHAAALAQGTDIDVSSLAVNSGVVITSISNFSNTTQLGSNTSGSNTELVTAKAIKDYVDSVVTTGGGGGAVNLDGLLDVTIGGVQGLVNRQVLLFDGGTNHWVNREILGQSNNITIGHNSYNDLIISLANTVDIETSLKVPTANIGTLVVTNTATFGNNATIGGTLGVSQQLTVARAATFGNNVVVGGSVSTNGNLTVNGTSTFSNTLTVQANAVVGQQLTTNNVAVSGNLVTSGGVTFSNTSANVVIDARIASDIIPAANNTFSLGSPGMRFKDIYVSATTLVIGNVVLSAANGTFTINTDVSISGNTTYDSSITVGGGLQVAQTATFNGNVVIGNQTSDRLTVTGLLASNVIPAANNVQSLGNTSNRFASVYANGVIASDGYFSGSVFVDGNLFVQGETTEVSVTTMTVEDPLIQLAANNASDVVDIGFYGLYKDGSTDRYTGLFRDASDSGKYVLFANTVAAPNTTVSRSSPSFRLSTLVAYMESGGLISSPTTISITGNSTLSVSIAANTLSLTTALGAASGGTGRTTLTQNAVLVGNGTTAVKQIAGQEMQVLSIVGGVPTFVASLDAGEY